MATGDYLNAVKNSPAGGRAGWSRESNKGVRLGVLGRSAEAIEVDGEALVARYGVLLSLDEIDHRRGRTGR
jgi:superfamily II DNA/RNA helicase